MKNTKAEFGLKKSNALIGFDKSAYLAVQLPSNAVMFLHWLNSPSQAKFPLRIPLGVFPKESIT